MVVHKNEPLCIGTDKLDDLRNGNVRVLVPVLPSITGTVLGETTIRVKEEIDIPLNATEPDEVASWLPVRDRENKAFVAIVAFGSPKLFT